MKQLLLWSMVAVMMIGGMSCNAAQGKNDQSAKKVAAQNVEVYYFHFTRRCITCKAVEAESKKALESLYPAQTKAGKITFEEINLDDESSKVLAEKLGIGGQSLLIVGGGKKIDLTSQGFMYAKSNPEKLKAEIKAAIDSLIK
ncbi:MAG: nitrophenyl compound nitroreductase subunit ArsF family protein [Bacteroidales bacterium]|jgi:hypothetical protein|nr:nitrophenyl compound nitroreductase subunit ArsF family protein [Bacteroidales bacterium]